jgi:flagellar biosynthesis/type III secretory pathway protein FliH
MIATATDTLCKLATLPLTAEQQVEFDSRRRQRFSGEVAAIGRRAPTATELEDYIYRAHELDLIEADRLTVVQLQEVVSELQRILPQAAQDELKRIQRTLSEFSQMRQAEANSNGAGQNRATGSEQGGEEKQEFADYLFAQSFQQLSTLIKSYRHIFITSTSIPVGQVAQI